MSGIGEDFASFDDFSGAVDLQENASGSGGGESNYLNWEVGQGQADVAAAGDFGDFSSFAADGGDATFDFAAADFDVATDMKGSDLALSAEDLAASGLDMEWAQKIGLSADVLAGDGETAAEGTPPPAGDVSFGVLGSASFDADIGVTGGRAGGGGALGSAGEDFGDFSGLSTARGNGDGSFGTDMPPSPVTQEEGSRSVPATPEAMIATRGVGGGESPASGAAEDFASFGSFGRDSVSTTAEDGFAAFDEPPPQALGGVGDDSFASFGATELSTPSSAGDVSFDATFAAGTSVAGEGSATDDDWGSFGATTSQPAAKDTLGAKETTVEAPDASGAFGSFSDSPADSGSFGDFDTGTHATSGQANGFEDDFSDFPVTAAKATPTDSPVDAGGDGFGDFGAFDQEASFPAADDGFATFESSAAASAGADGFGSFGEPTGSTDGGFSDFAEHTIGGDDWDFPVAAAPAPAVAVAPAGTSLFSAADSMNLVEMDDISFRREVAKTLESIFGATAKTATGTDALPPPSLRTLLTTGPDGSTRCKRCKSVTFPTSHICLTCGDIIVQHSLQDQWTDNHATKHKFAQVMYIPEAKASHHNPLQPSAPGQVLPTAVAIQEASKLAPPLSPMRGDEPPVLVATSLDPSEPSISLLPMALPDNPPEPRSSAPVQLTDFDLSVFGEIAPAKQTSAAASSSSDFDSFLLGFDSASMSTQDSEMASIASINEKIEQQSRKKKQARRGASEDTMEAELDSSHPADSKKLLEIMNKIPDLTFMSSKTLVVPASNYSFALSSNAGTR